MHNILTLILEATRKRIHILRKNREVFQALIKKAPRPLPFKDAVKRDNKFSIVGEIKQASPSAGVLNKDFSFLDIAKTYQRCKINALSVVTEQDFFLGKLKYIEEIKKEVNLPVLRKDFILDEIQVLESRAAGADAILLIAKILDKEKLNTLYKLTKELGMDVLLEVHTEKELRTALKVGAGIIGINNRNLNTFKVDLGVTEKLAPFLPADVVKISESGITCLKDVLLLRGAGINAALIGETFMKADNLEAKIKELNIDA